MKPIVSSLAVSLVLAAASAHAPRAAAPEGHAMKITSPAFAPQQSIPKVYTCDGRDVSPPLAWSEVPAGARSLALIVDDPDAPDPKAPRMTWVHWVLYDLPRDSKGLAQGVAARSLPAGTREGLNDWQRAGYGGPCPPVGRHRYFFKLYALDTLIGPLPHPDKAAVERAMHGHVLAHAELVATYQH